MKIEIPIARFLYALIGFGGAFALAVFVLFNHAYLAEKTTIPLVVLLLLILFLAVVGAASFGTRFGAVAFRFVHGVLASFLLSALGWSFLRSGLAWWRTDPPREGAIFTMIKALLFGSYAGYCAFKGSPWGPGAKEAAQTETDRDARDERIAELRELLAAKRPGATVEFFENTEGLTEDELFEERLELERDRFRPMDVGDGLALISFTLVYRLGSGESVLASDEAAALVSRLLEIPLKESGPLTIAADLMDVGTPEDPFRPGAARSFDGVQQVNVLLRWETEFLHLQVTDASKV